MPASTSVLSRYAKRLFANYPASGSFRPANRISRRRKQPRFCVPAEFLEERTLLSAATLGSAISVGSTWNVAHAVATDAAGDSYVTGRFSGTVNFNPNGTAVDLTAIGVGDVFVAKYDVNDNLIWVDQMGGNGTTANRGESIALDSSGNIYVAGNFSGTTTFGSTQLTTSATGSEAFVEKLNTNGTVQWAESYGGNGENAVGVGVDSSGNVYALGYSSSNNIDTILKFSPNGSTVWSESISTNITGSPDGFAVDGSGDVFVCGNFDGTVNFSPTGRAHYVTAPEVTSGFVLKLNTSGNFQWVSTFIGQTVGSSVGTASLQSLTLDGNGNVIVGGTYSGTVDFNSGTTTLPTAGGGLLAKLNGSGGLDWAEGLVGVFPEGMGISGIAVDASNNIYVAGVFSGTIAFNPNSTQTWTAAGTLDAFVMEVNSSGNFDWVDTFGGSGAWTELGGIAVDPNDTIHVAGWYNGTVNFNPNPNGTPDDLSSTGTWSDYLLTLNQP